MKRTFVVTGSASGLGADVSEKLRHLGERVIGVDFSHAEVTADLSTVAGRLEAAEKVLELSGGTINSIIACAEFNVPKPVAISVNYFGVTHFVEALSDILMASRPSTVVVFADDNKQNAVCESLVSAMLSGDEPRALFLAQNLADESVERAHLIYASSKRGLHLWSERERNLKQWAGSGISLHCVNRKKFAEDDHHSSLVDLVISLTHPMNLAI